ncbi:MAG: hypothetical protein ACTH29_03135 [Fusobacterium sp.]
MMIVSFKKPNFPFIVDSKKADEFNIIVETNQKKNVLSSIAKSKKRREKLMERSKCLNIVAK